MATSQRSDHGGTFIIDATVDLASVAAAITANQSVTVNGVLSTDEIIAVIPPTTLNNGLAVVQANVTADNTVTLRVINATAGALDAASATFRFVVARH